MRTLLVTALAATLVDCAITAASEATDSCASRNPLACWTSVACRLSRRHLTTNSAVESKLAIAPKTREIAVRSRTAQQRQPADVEQLAGRCAIAR